MPLATVLSTASRVTVTPNATMTTLASPTQGGAATVNLWKVAMSAGQQGPLHSFDTEQAWHLLDGEATVYTPQGCPILTPGDTVVLTAGQPRQIRALADSTFIVTGPVGGRATPDQGEPTAPPWLT